MLLIYIRSPFSRQMGYVGDLLGRNAAMTFTLSLVFISALASALVPTGSSTAVYTTIIIARFFLGIGVGGVYPLSASKAAEDGGDAHGNVDPSAAGWSFFWQVPGTMVSFLFSRFSTIFFSFCVSFSLPDSLVVGSDLHTHQCASQHSLENDSGSGRCARGVGGDLFHN